MIKQNAKVGMCAFALLIQPAQIRADVPEAIKKAGIVGGIAAGAYLIGSGLCNLFTTSNDTLINAARRAGDDAHARVNQVAYYLRAGNHGQIPSIHHSDENLLFGLAQNHIRGSVDVYTKRLADAQRQMERAKNDLTERMRKLERNGECYSSDYRIMESQVEGLKEIEREVRAVYAYIDHYSSYFILYNCEENTRRKYSSMIDIVDQCGGNRLMMVQYIREQIARDGISSRNPYPTISCAEKLTDDLKALERASNRCVYKYPNRLMFARDLYSKLSEVLSILLADERYVYEMNAREQARREQERLRLEQERINAERRKAEAAERQARAQRDQMYEMRRQTEELRKQRERSEYERRNSERDRLERERVQLERERVSLERERVEQEQRELERQEREQREKERLERERRQRQERERLEKEREQRERERQNKIERDRKAKQAQEALDEWESVGFI